MQSSNQDLIINKNNERKNRKHNAVALPIDISNIVLPKYVVYYRECYNHEKNLWREFFKIEHHPLQKHAITSSKSNKVTIIEKLNYINTILQELQENQYENQDNIKKNLILPKYISLNNTSNPHYLIYDNKSGTHRKCYRMNLPNNYDIDKSLQLFKKKILEHDC